MTNNRLPDLSATADDAVDERDAPGEGVTARRVLVVDDSREHFCSQCWAQRQ